MYGGFSVDGDETIICAWLGDDNQTIYILSEYNLEIADGVGTSTNKYIYLYKVKSMDSLTSALGAVRNH